MNNSKHSEMRDLTAQGGERAVASPKPVVRSPSTPPFRPAPKTYEAALRALGKSKSKDR